MRYLDEFRDPAAAAVLVDAIRRRATKPWTVMEVCGGQTHSIIRNGIDQLLAGAVEFIHGPGCPVCVTPLEMIDRALAIAARPDVIFCSFGDMLRVPGSSQDLFGVRARGGDVRIVYSPLDATRIAADNPDKQVVFFGVGFETTAPANAMAVLHAQRLGLTNFSMLVSHVLVPPAMTAILSSPTNRVQGFLAAGHVCSVMGTSEYEPLVTEFGVPIVVTGFEPLDLLEGVRQVVELLEEGTPALRNAYPRAVSAEGNLVAQKTLAEVFAVTDRQWRGIGMIPRSGWTLSPRYAEFDAERRFGVGHLQVAESSDCRSGEVLQGLLKPNECPAFGRTCTPRTPLGATMVSSEGACAAYYQFRRLETAAHA
ncbi:MULTISPECIES: hydrogenase formation protein HypD [Mycolicibacterium]|uniref:Hydrogenase expression/formation protein HypD n=1 Tax=Mycolicibacterium vanbaalenii (strain DSM 7251 / JCM 13017 / BCRC 16820 / KCTC 9966 / NRRL B-24157 / PYR-1) TaxID=350058 RepID=A1T7M5_MYCVP|nr:MULTISPECIES: hydrogenase formation protein HypD [Mycolicibacterium]ABM13175.1 hydrogenase expression/formation protein HypD [Mycolicibacterium vanbaalenii PYR-1]MCV7127470.1 hydrogenase formation protein HypD [Mycolicibacterium vanbaalenii PYR-1]MDW5613161.1 hydrogenase formation protein HypD [Mycolicibacterium sp. D5.8-2]